MRLSWRIELPLLLMIAAMFAVAAWAWPQLPERLPVHWNIHGEADGYGGKFTGLLLLPIIVAGLYLLMLVIPLVDPGRSNYPSFKKAFNVIRVSLVLYTAAIYAVTVAAAFGRKVDMHTVILSAMGILFLVLGNFMSKIRPNWFVGVRTPWTLSSRLSWDKTHRLAGWLFVLMGLLSLVVALVPTTVMFIGMLAADALCLTWVVVYSYLVYRSDPHPVKPAGSSREAE
jgi:uncharacterized membrane protein